MSRRADLVLARLDADVSTRMIPSSRIRASYYTATTGLHRVMISPGLMIRSSCRTLYPLEIGMKTLTFQPSAVETSKQPLVYRD